MKILFLDIDGVLNSHQSMTFWYKHRDMNKWQNELYGEWKGTLAQYLALDFDPIALSNLEELLKRVPDLKIVVSSTWRLGRSIDELREIFLPFRTISRAIISKTGRDYDRIRGNEIQEWLDKHPEIEKYAIVDDDSDMLDSQKPYFVQTNNYNGLQFTDMLKLAEILK